MKVITLANTVMVDTEIKFQDWVDTVKFDPDATVLKNQTGDEFFRVNIELGDTAPLGKYSATINTIHEDNAAIKFDVCPALSGDEVKEAAKDILIQYLEDLSAVISQIAATYNAMAEARELIDSMLQA